MKKPLATLGAILLLASSVTVLGATPSQAAGQNLGGLSVQTACNAYKPGSTARVAVNNVTGWRCSKAWTADMQVGTYLMSFACLQKYGGKVRADYENYNNPYSWRCYRL